MIPLYLSRVKENLTFIEVKSEKAEALKSERSIVHYISTDDVDRGKDVMIAKGMDDTDFQESPSVWYNHEYRFNDHALPVAKSLWRKKEEHGVLVKSQFATTEFADDVYRLHEGGFMNTWSIGFQPKYDKHGNIEKGSIIHDEGTGITTYHKWNLYEYSSAPIAMNPHARDLIKMQFKSPITKSIIELARIEVNVKDKLAEFESELNEIKGLKQELQDLIERTDGNEKSIIELTEYINKKTYTIEIPIKKISGDRIANAVKRSLKGQS
uniref:Putative peptidase n=1 Tax=viral metagenome TaxID=1070528 RepID=A0A6M3L833_9ZZZZ